MLFRNASKLSHSICQLFAFRGVTLFNAAFLSNL